MMHSSTQTSRCPCGQMHAARGSSPSEKHHTRKARTLNGRNFEATMTRQAAGNLRPTATRPNEPSQTVTVRSRIGPSNAATMWHQVAHNRTRPLPIHIGRSFAATATTLCSSSLKPRASCRDVRNSSATARTPNEGNPRLRAMTPASLLRRVRTPIPIEPSCVATETNLARHGTKLKPLNRSE